MEIWLRLEDGDAPPDCGQLNGTSFTNHWAPTFRIEDGRLMSGQETIGAFVVIKDGATQRQAVSLIGSVEWLLVECEDWSMIPTRKPHCCSAWKPDKNRRYSHLAHASTRRRVCPGRGR